MVGMDNANRLCKYCDASLPDDGETKHDPECPWNLATPAQQEAMDREDARLVREAGNPKLVN
jgi:hypothetical protein